MPKMTLLAMTQDILSDMNEDQVNSIDDTYISDRVASIVKQTYFALINDRIWPTHDKMITLEASGDNDYPTHMKLPESTSSITWIKYNTKDQTSDATGLDTYGDVIYLEPAQFADTIMSRNPAASNVQTVVDNLTTSSIKLLVLNNATPSYWTSFDDEYIIFDSYDATYDTTLQAHKTMVSAHVEPSWTHSDSFTPDLPVKGFPLLLSEAKKSAFAKIKQIAEPIENERARRQRTWMAGEKRRTRSKAITYPDYGRKRV